MNVKVTEFRQATANNTLKGFATIEFPGDGIRLNDVAYHENHKKSWFQLPTQKFRLPNGQRGFNHILDFTSKELYYQFQDSARSALSMFRGELGGNHETSDN